MEETAEASDGSANDGGYQLECKSSDPIEPIALKLMEENNDTTELGDRKDVMDFEEEGIDPRIRHQLENLNQLTFLINSLEKQFEELNDAFRNLLNESSDKLKQLANRLGSKIIDKVRPYHECKEKAKQAQVMCQKAAIHYDRASYNHAQAKQTIQVAEQRFEQQKSRRHDGETDGTGTGADFDPTWQEMLNQATIKVMEAENTKKESEMEHNRCMKAYLTLEQSVLKMERKLRNLIRKSKPYFEESARFQCELNGIKEQIQRLNETIFDTKRSYSLTLKKLELISEETHERRNQRMAKILVREPGVGAEVIDVCTSDREIAEQPAIVTEIAEEELCCEFALTDTPATCEENSIPCLNVESPRCQMEVKPRLSAVTFSIGNVDAIDSENDSEVSEVTGIPCDRQDNGTPAGDDNGSSNVKSVINSFEEIELN